VPATQLCLHTKNQTTSAYILELKHKFKNLLVKKVRQRSTSQFRQ